jgi:hypothetical protein
MKVHKICLNTSYKVGDMAQKFLPSCRKELDYEVLYKIGIPGCVLEPVLSNIVVVKRSRSKQERFFELILFFAGRPLA